MEDSPTIISEATLLPQALHLLDRREVYKTNKKINLFLLLLYRCSGGCGWKKRIKKGFVCRLAIAYNDPGSLAKCEERAFCQAGIIRSSKGYFLA